MNMGFKIVDPNKFFICFLIALTLLIIIRAFMDWNQAIALASAAGTIIAAYAAWRAAREAAKSAEIARESMDATKALGLETLKETQLANQRTAFESRYTMLLTHHDHYHQQLCDYLDAYWQHNNELERIDVDESQIDEIKNFFNKSMYAEHPNECFSFLTGHQIISRYMRVLYHLLKFVYENGAFEESEKIRFQKNYTSPVRSTIRNDVLLLIAVNALNVRSQGAKNSSYPFYQQMLHDFSFFEHAIFMFPSNPNSLFSRDDWETRIHNLVINTQSDFTSKLSAQTGDANQVFRIPEVRLISPMIMVLYIFDNPMRDAVLKAFDSLGMHSSINNQVIEKIKEVATKVQTAESFVDKLSSSDFKYPSNNMWRSITEDIVSELNKSTFSSYSSYDSYTFRFSGVSNVMAGSLVRDHLKTIKRNQSILEEFEMQKGAVGFTHYLAQHHNSIVASSLNEIESYNVTSSQYAAQQSEIPEEE